MKKPKTYIQVFIESTDDLPTKKGKYWSGFNDKPSEMDLREFDPNNSDDIFVMNHLDWYFKPVEQPSDEEIEEWAKNLCNSTFTGVYHSDFGTYAIIGAKAARDGNIPINKKSKP